MLVEGSFAAAANMARDETMLEAAFEGLVTLRFYSWRPHSFSIGYFQNRADFDVRAGADTPVVRRPSGGGAIYHADEITYCLAGPCSAGPFPRRSADIFEKIHVAIAAGLRSIGVDAELFDAPPGASPLICFSRPQRYDIVVGRRKLLGSAQRRKDGAFLQHGSLPMSPNKYAPEAISLDEVLGGRPDDADVIAALALGFREALGLEFGEAEFSAQEEARASRIEDEKYATDEWNRRR